MSTTFQTASPMLQKFDPLKRVNYTFGLVLGVEEFLQSDVYFLAKHHLENRLLHGHGTVCGLDVIRQTSPVLEVQVTPGWAINPRGQEIRVPQLMCVQVAEWVQANLSALQALYPGTAPATLRLCVVLCARECKTDVVPIPGEPCQTQSSSSAPSRIADSFELMLCLDPELSPPLSSPPASRSSLCEFRPTMGEDDGVRSLVQLLSQIQSSGTGPFLTWPELKQLVLDLGTRGSSTTPASPPAASPPYGPPYYVPPSELSQFLHAAVRIWITEVLPFLPAGQGRGPCCPPAEKCVLLAEVTVFLTSNWSAVSVTVDDSRRPFLMSTRLLQELLLREPDTAALSAPISPYQVVGAGYFNSSGHAVFPVFNGLQAQLAKPSEGEYLLSFTGYRNPSSSPPPGISYIVKGTIQDFVQPSLSRATLEFVDFESTGIRIRILDTNLEPLSVDLNWGFMVEISQIGVGA